MRLTLKSKVVLLALIPVVLFALVLSGAAAKVLQNLAAQEVKETRERLLQESRNELQIHRFAIRRCKCTVEHFVCQRTPLRDVWKALPAD